MSACEAGNLKAATCFIGAGANLHHRDNSGHSALDLAEQVALHGVRQGGSFWQRSDEERKEHETIVALLNGHGAP